MSLFKAWKQPTPSPKKALRDEEAEVKICYQCKYWDCAYCIDLDVCEHEHWWNEEILKIVEVFWKSTPQAFIPRNQSSRVREDGLSQAQFDLPPSAQAGS